MKLPGQAHEISEVIGRERALYLIGQLPRCLKTDKRYPGAKSYEVILYVPHIKRLNAEHGLVRILGWNDAAKLCRFFGGELLKPPTCAEIYRRFRDDSIRSLVNDGMSAGDVACVMGVTVRHIRSLVREIPPEAIPAAANDNAGLIQPAMKRDRQNNFC